MLKSLFNRLVVSFFLICPFYANAQKVWNVNLNLSTNGEVYDVEYFAPLSAYIVVGDFTSIKSITRKNFAVIDNSGNVLSHAPILQMDSAIRCVTIVNNRVFLGGDFSVFNTTNFRAGLIELNYSAGIFNVTSFDPFQNATGKKVFDMISHNNSVLTVVGKFDGYEDLSLNFSLRNNIVQFNANTKIVTSNFISGISTSTPLINNYRMNLAYNTSKFYVYGLNLFSNTFNGSVIVFDLTGTAINSFNESTSDLTRNLSFLNNGLVVIETTRNTLTDFDLQILNTINWNSLSNYTSYFDQNGLIYQNPNPTIQNLGFGTIADKDNQFYSLFKNSSTGFHLIRMNYDSTNVDFTRNNFCSVDTLFPILSSNPTTLDLNFTKHLFIANNKLFVSSPYLTQTNGISTARFSAFCLPPRNILEFNNSYNVATLPGDPEPPKNIDTIVCEGNIKGYGFSPVTDAIGYKYTIIGSGIDFNFGISLNSQPITSYYTYNGNDTSVYVQTGFSNQIWLKFKSGFTGGILKVEPYTLCNNSTDYVLAKPIYLNLTLAPLPSLTIPDTSYLNCLNSSIDLTINSSTAGVTKQWYDNNNNLLSNDTISLIYSDVLPANSDYYVAVIQETSDNLCRNTDTAHVFLDIRKPVLAPDSTLFGTWNCITDSLQVGVIDTGNFNTLPIDLQFSTNDTNYYSAQPFYIFNPNPVYFVGTYPINGCSDSLIIPITTNLTPPNSAEITKSVDGLNYNGTDPYLDILTCINDSSLFVLSDTSGYQNYWVFDNDTIYDSLDLSIYAPQFIGFSDSVNTNYTLYYGSLNPSNGCRSNLFISFIDLDISQPLFIPFSGNSTYTCSEDSLLLDHDLVLTVNSQGWISGGTSDTLVYATSPGNYIYEIEGFNGCKSFDTVIVNQNSVLTFEPLSDRIVCPNDTFTLTTQAQGSETVSYSWNGSFVNQTFIGEGGVDTLMIVQANSLSGCSGIDSIYVRITDPITTTFSGYAECGGNISIQVTGVNGGAASDLSDYSFRFNDQTVFIPFSGNLPNYPVDSFASYPFWIQDSLNCIYELETTITGEILNPITEFLVSTYNQSLDTIYIANINQYAGFDFMEWSSSNLQVNWIQTFDSSALFSYNDTGWVEIQFTGFVIDTNDFDGTVDTCSYPFSKWIYFGENEVIWDDSLSLGVNSIDVYQNPALSGTATVTLNFSLGSQLEYQVYTTDGIGSKIPALCFTGNGVGAISHSLILPGLAAGNYYINVLTKYGGKQVNLIVQ